MTTLATTVTTLQDLQSLMDPQGRPIKVAEILTKDAPILEDIPWMMGNLPTGHLHAVRTGLPSPTWRKLNYGVPQSKGTQVQVTDTCGMLEDYSEVDARLVKLNGHSAAWRMSMDKPHIEGFRQTLASTLFYGDTTVDPEKFMGLTPRFNTLSTATAQTANNVIAADSGASGATQTSIWLIGWGEHTVHGIYPKGTEAGLDMRDLGEDTSVDANGLKYQVMRTHFQWDCGLAVPDWRYIVRICNIDVDNLTKTGSTGSDLVDALVQATEKIQSLEGVRAAFYANRRITSFLRRQIMNKSNIHLTLDQVAGKRVLAFDGIPFRRTDAILNTESVVS